MWTKEPNAMKRTSITKINETGSYVVTSVATLPTSWILNQSIVYTNNYSCPRKNPASIPSSTNRWKLSREVVTVYCKNHTEQTHFLLLHLTVYIVITRLFTVLKHGGYYMNHLFEYSKLQMLPTECVDIAWITQWRATVCTKWIEILGFHKAYNQMSSNL
jgi:hypothetical protein